MLEEQAAITSGPLFRSINRHGKLQPGRLSGIDVAPVVKKLAQRAWLGPAKYAGHSLRAGCATTAAIWGRIEKDPSPPPVQRPTRWYSTLGKSLFLLETIVFGLLSVFPVEGLRRLDPPLPEVRVFQPIIKCGFDGNDTGGVEAIIHPLHHHMDLYVVECAKSCTAIRTTEALWRVNVVGRYNRLRVGPRHLLQHIWIYQLDTLVPEVVVS